MKRISLILAFLASTASADTAQRLGECYFNEGLRAKGLDPHNISPLLTLESAALRLKLDDMAETAVGLRDATGSLDIVNLGVRVASEGEPELSAAFIRCNNQHLAD